MGALKTFSARGATLAGIFLLSALPRAGSAQAAIAVATPNTATPEAVTIRIEDVVKKVSAENYEVLQNAQRVYQAKETIAVARGNLLPRLNLWKITSLGFEAVMGAATYNYGAVSNAALSMVEDIAPFLVPANWLRIEEARIFLLAEKEAYRALWANEVMTAKSLYFHSLLDRSILEHVEKNIREFETLHTIIASRETLGGIPPNTAREVESRLLALREDKRALETVIIEENTLLSYMMGYPTKTDVALAPVESPDFSRLVPLKYGDFEFRALDSSPEIRQHSRLIEAADYVKKEVAFSFLGASSAMRGAQGGVFDGLPLQMGLGFGTGPSMRIVKAQKEILGIQKKAVAETVGRQLKLLINNYNLDLANYPDLKRHVEIAAATLAWLYERINLGQDVESLTLVEASRNHIQAEVALLAAQFRFLVNEDKLRRLIFHGDYAGAPAAPGFAQRRARAALEAVDPLRAEAEKLVDAVPYQAEPQEAFRAYFSELESIAFRLKQDRGFAKSVGKAVAKTDLDATCAAMFLPKPVWERIAANCDRNGIFLCSEKIRGYGDSVAAFRDALPPAQQSRFDAAPACTRARR
ncbi:MAG: TolC family protein [Deltaproteobacteria bacterium]|nr:TolC family protein [Deltaproteobacteria bacterium]